MRNWKSIVLPGQVQRPEWFTPQFRREGVLRNSSFERNRNLKAGNVWSTQFWLWYSQVMHHQTKIILSHQKKNVCKNKLVEIKLTTYIFGIYSGWDCDQILLLINDSSIVVPFKEVRLGWHNPSNGCATSLTGVWWVLFQNVVFFSIVFASILVAMISSPKEYWPKKAFVHTSFGL